MCWGIPIIYLLLIINGNLLSIIILPKYWLIILVKLYEVVCGILEDTFSKEINNSLDDEKGLLYQYELVIILYVIVKLALVLSIIPTLGNKANLYFLSYSCSYSSTSCKYTCTTYISLKHHQKV